MALGRGIEVVGHSGGGDIQHVSAVGPATTPPPRPSHDTPLMGLDEAIGEHPKNSPMSSPHRHHWSLDSNDSWLSDALGDTTFTASATLSSKRLERWWRTWRQQRPNRWRNAFALSGGPFPCQTNAPPAEDGELSGPGQSRPRHGERLQHVGRAPAGRTERMAAISRQPLRHDNMEYVRRKPSNLRPSPYDDIMLQELIEETRLGRVIGPAKAPDYWPIRTHAITS